MCLELVGSQSNNSFIVANQSLIAPLASAPTSKPSSAIEGEEPGTARR